MKTWLVLSALVITLILKPIYAANAVVYSQTLDQVPVLMQNHSIEKQLQAEQKHIYHLPLITGQFAEVAVEQLGIDLVISAFDPTGKQIVAIDSPVGTEGLEIIFLIAEMEGNYTIEITSLNNSNKIGTYKVEIKDLRLATNEDQITIQAQNLCFEGLLIQAKKQDVENNLKQAINKCKEAAMLYQQNQMVERQATAYLLIGNIFERSSNKEEQIKWYLKALELYIQAPNKKREADVALNLGELYKLTGNTKEALAYNLQALAIYQALRDIKNEIIILNNIGSVYDLTGENTKAIDYYQEALDKLAEKPNPTLEITLLSNLAIVLNTLGENQKAINRYTQALDIAKSTDAYKGIIAVILSNLAVVYDDLGELERSQDYYLQALPIFEETKDPRGKAITLANLGNIQIKQKDFNKALGYYSQANNIFKTISNYRGQAAALNKIGNIFIEAKEYKKALDYLTQSLEFRRKAGDKYGEIYSLNSLGKVLFLLGDKEKPLDLYIQALQISKDLGDLKGQMTTFFNLAVFEKESKNIKNALTNIEQAVDIAEKLRLKVTVRDLRASFLATAQDCYELYIDLLMMLDESTNNTKYKPLAFEISERKRARSLLDSLVEARVDLRENISPELAKEFKDLQYQYGQKTEKLIRLKSKNAKDEQIPLLEKELNDLKSKFEHLEATLKLKHPKYSSIAQAKALTIGEVQSLLDTETSLIEYSITSTNSYVWVISKGSIKSYKLANYEEIKFLVDKILLSAKNNYKKQAFDLDEDRLDSLETIEKEYVDDANKLSDLIIKPIWNDLPTTKRLLVVPDSILQYIPFAALPTPSLPSTTGKDWTPLIANSEIISLPSVSTLSILRKELTNRKPPTKTLAIIADPIFDSSDERISKNITKPFESKDMASNVRGEQLRDKNFSRIKFTGNEAKQIRELVSKDQTMLAMGLDASIPTITNPSLAQFGIIHIASHSLLDVKTPELSAVVLSLVNENGEDTPGFLTAKQIYSLNLPVNLVVLSACETGLGKELKGEGIVGLTRAFMYAGAARVIVSLWKVDDKATSELMVRFYKYLLKEHITPSQALQKAQLSMRNDPAWKLPYYWAGFVIQGECK